MKSNLTDHFQLGNKLLNVDDFAYVPLDAERQEFRLLTVHASSGHDTICATITTQSLLEKPHYETVSYCWGDASTRGEIILNGYLFDLPASTENALGRLRYDDTDRVLWIDAICINQTDIDERSHQVAMMDGIYRSGVRNLIWLGEAEPCHADDAVKVFNTVWQGILSVTGGDGDISASVQDGQRNRIRLVNSPVVESDFDFRPILRVFQKPWFARLWVIQEAALSASNTCLFGHRELDLVQILRISKWLLHSMAFLPDNFNPNKGMHDAAEMWSYVDPFLRPPYRYYHAFSTRAMATGRNFKATEPRDYFYGILGLAHVSMGHPPANDPLLLPDYRRTLKETYTNAAKYTLKETGELEFLAMVFRREVDRDTSWPSWLPRWNRPFDVLRDAFPLPCDHKAGIVTQLLARFSTHATDPSLAVFAGSIFDTVKHANEPLPWPADDLWNEVNYKRDGIVESYHDVKATFAQHANDNDQQESRWPVVLGQTLTGGMTCFDQVLEPESTGEVFLLFDQHMQTGTLSREIDCLSHAEGPAYLVSKMLISMRTMWTHRRFFVTEGGFVGLGPSLMAPGDRVAILNGSRFCAVLRPLGDGTHEFMGTAYVHGVMEGQLIDGELKDKRGPDVEIWMR